VSKITIPRADLTADEVVQALHDGLGARYNVLPGMSLSPTPYGRPVPGTPDTIVVGTGNNRVWRTQVSMVRRSGNCELHIGLGGGPLERLRNLLVITPKVRRVLANAAQLRQAR
jgi:hypothetical protein